MLPILLLIPFPIPLLIHMGSLCPKQLWTTRESMLPIWWLIQRLRLSSKCYRYGYRHRARYRYGDCSRAKASRPEACPA